VVEHPTTVPAIVQLRPPPGAFTIAQTPARVAVAPVHAPPQQSNCVRHASPVCLQNDVAALHLPPMHPPEQHSPLPPLVLPDALQLPPL